MDHDVLMLIYGVLLGALSSVITSIITAVFQVWLERREYERRRIEEQHKQIRLLYLPTEEEIRIISAQHAETDRPQSLRRFGEVGTIVFSIVVCSLLITQTDNPNLGFGLASIPGFLVTNSVIRLLKR